MTIVRLPWPPSALSPNGAHGHWRAKSSAAKAYKDRCRWCCIEAKMGKLDLDQVEVTVTFHPPSRRRYDLDNALARIKQGLDAVSEAIGIDDGKWRSMTLERGEVVKGGAVIVHVTAYEPSWVPNDYRDLRDRIVGPGASEI